MATHGHVLSSVSENQETRCTRSGFVGLGRIHKLVPEKLKLEASVLKEQLRSGVTNEIALTNCHALIDDIAYGITSFTDFSDQESVSELALRPKHGYIPAKTFTKCKFEFYGNQATGSNNLRPDSCICLKYNNGTVFPLLICEDKARRYCETDFQKLREAAREGVKSGLQLLSSKIDNPSDYSKYCVIMIQSYGNTFSLYKFTKTTESDSHRLKTKQNTTLSVSFDSEDKNNEYSYSNITNVYDALTITQETLFNTVNFILTTIIKQENKVKPNYPPTPERPPQRIKSIKYNGNTYTKLVAVDDFVSIYLFERKQIIVKHLTNKTEKDLFAAALSFAKEYTVSGEVITQDEQDLLLMEPGRPLNNIEEFTYEICNSIIERLLEAVVLYHKNCLIHSDIKLANLILDADDKLRIIDFGHAKLFKSEVDGVAYDECYIPIGKKSGTMSFAAPELLSEDLYGTKVDCFSIGVVLLRIIAQIEGNTMFELRDNVLDTKLRNSFFTNAKESHPYKRLVDNLLMVDPKKRCSAVEALSTLRQDVLDNSKKRGRSIGESQIDNDQDMESNQKKLKKDEEASTEDAQIPNNIL